MASAEYFCPEHGWNCCQCPPKFESFEDLVKRHLLHDLVLDLVLKHPLPWRSEMDWTEEIYDADGHLVVKVMGIGTSDLLLRMAEEIKRSTDGTEIWLEAVLPTSGTEA